MSKDDGLRVTPQDDVEWLRRFLNCTPFSPPPSEVQRAQNIVTDLLSSLSTSRLCTQERDRRVQELEAAARAIPSETVSLTNPQTGRGQANGANAPESHNDKPHDAPHRVDDNFGTFWECQHGLPTGVCGMQVVRPGKSQCVCDGGVKATMQEIHGLNTELDRLENAIEAGAMRSAGTRLTHPQSHDEAQKRIAECVREIEMIADTFGYDPFEWLADDDSSVVSSARTSLTTEQIFEWSQRHDIHASVTDLKAMIKDARSL